MSLDLRPLTLGELFDRAFMLYRRHFLLFVGIAAVPGVFALLLNLGQLWFQNVAAQITRTPADEAALVFGQMPFLLGGMLGASIGYMVLYVVAFGATTIAVSEIYLGGASTIAESYSRIRGRVGRLLRLMLVVAARIMGVALLAIVLSAFAISLSVLVPLVGGVLMMLIMLCAGALVFVMTLRYALSVPALVLEGLHARQSVKRSIELTKGRLGRVFLLILCSVMITYAGAVLFQGPFFAAVMMTGPETTLGTSLGVVGAIFGTLGTTLTAPFMIIGLALIYYDARVREEGFDLEMTLAALDREAAPARV